MTPPPPRSHPQATVKFLSQTWVAVIPVRAFDGCVSEEEIVAKWNMDRECWEGFQSDCAFHLITVGDF